MKAKWKEKTAADKALSVGRIVVSAAVVVLALMQLLELWDRAMNIVVPLMGINLLIIAAQEWKQSRGAAIFSICAAVFVLGCAAAVWFLP